MDALAGELDLPGARGGAGEVVVRAGFAQKAEIAPDEGRRQRFESRSEGRTEWTVHRWVGMAPGSYEVLVRDPGSDALRRRVEVTADAPPPG